MIAQVVSAPELPFQDDLAEGFVLGVKAVAPQRYRYASLLPFVLRTWPKQGTAGHELETACAHLGSARTVIVPRENDPDMALGFVLGVLAANSNKVVPFPDIVEHSRTFVRWTDQPAALEEAARTLFGLGLVSIESMSSPLAKWCLWLRHRPEMV